ncbi:MAG: PKD domain-containing protein, partial [Bacteroidia bacterium]|nr:PKD domain-containing protein [Bacteroidia bacterium]
MILRLIRLFHFLALLLPTLVQAQVPANDACASATNLGVSSNNCLATLTTNVNATSIGDPVPACWGSPPSHTVWYRFQAGNTRVQINTMFANSNFLLTNTQIAVYSGTCGALTQIACQENASGTVLNNNLTLTGLTIGTTYYIMVDGFGPATGNFAICVTNVPAPPASSTPNDCNAAQSLCNLNPINVPNNSPLFGAGSVNEIPTCFGLSGTPNSIWYSFTAQTSGLLCFTLTPNVINADFDFAIFNVTNGCLGTQVACDFAAPTNGGITGLGCSSPAGCPPCINVTAGNTYAIVINRYTTGSVSGYSLNFTGSTFTASSVTPTPAFTTPPVCQGQAVNFTNTTPGNNSYLWNFGIQGAGNAASQSANPSFTYPGPGTYNVALTAVSNCGAPVTTILPVTVTPGPPLTITPADTVVCNGVPVQLTATVNASGTINQQFTFTGPGVAIPDNNPAGAVSTTSVTGVSPTVF